MVARSRPYRDGMNGPHFVNNSSPIDREPLPEAIGETGPACRNTLKFAACRQVFLAGGLVSYAEVIHLTSFV